MEAQIYYHETTKRIHLVVYPTMRGRRFMTTIMWGQGGDPTVTNVEVTGDMESCVQGVMSEEGIVVTSAGVLIDEIDEPEDEFQIVQHSSGWWYHTHTGDTSEDTWVLPTRYGYYHDSRKVMADMLRNVRCHMPLEGMGNMLDGLGCAVAVDVVREVWGEESEEMGYTRNYFNLTGV
jgi:hypothetical protein